MTLQHWALLMRSHSARDTRKIVSRRSHAAKAFGQQVRFQIHKSLFNRRLGLLAGQSFSLKCSEVVPNYYGESNAVHVGNCADERSGCVTGAAEHLSRMSTGHFAVSVDDGDAVDAKT